MVRNICCTILVIVGVGLGWWTMTDKARNPAYYVMMAGLVALFSWLIGVFVWEWVKSIMRVVVKTGRKIKNM